MAKLTLNSALKRVRGGIDDWVYRRVGSKMVISPRSDVEPKPPSPGQVAARNAFRTALSYAKGVLGDPIKRAVYDLVAKAREIPILAVAVGDYFKPPQVHVIETTEYHGKIGDKIKILASDDVEVVSVRVVISEANGVVIEQGAAAKINDEWLYTATTVVAMGHPVKIQATATDRPTHTGQLEVPYTIA